MPHDDFPELYSDQYRRITDNSPEAQIRRLTLEERMVILENKVERLQTVENKLDRNTELTQHVVDVFQTLEAGIRVLGGLGRIAKWAAPIVALCATVWSLFHGKPPSVE